MTCCPSPPRCSPPSAPSRASCARARRSPSPPPASAAWPRSCSRPAWATASAVSTAGFGGLAEVLFKACLGNRIGFEVSEAYYEADARDLFDHSYGCFIVELDEGAALPEVDGACVVELGSTAGFGGLAEVLFKACLGNRIGFEVSEAYYEADARDLFDHSYGCFIVELDEGAALPEVDGACVVELGVTCEPYELTAYGETLDLDELQEAWASALEGVYPERSAADDVDAPEELIPEERYRCEEEGRIRATYGGLKIAKPRVIIPVFPGNNCEFDSARAPRCPRSTARARSSSA